MMVTTSRSNPSNARCESCNKSYRIPDVEQTYTCKACGGAIRAITAPRTARRPKAGEISCTKCHAVLPDGTLTCPECGTQLGVPDPKPRDEDATISRHETTEALKAGYRWIEAVTWVFRLGALGYAGVTLAAVVALSQSEIPLRPGVLVVVLSTVLTVLMLMAAIQILFRPFVWVLIVATLATGVSAAHFVGPNPLGLASFFSGGWALVLWLGLVPTLRFQRLMSEHKDVYIMHHASRRTRRAVLQQRSPVERHKRLVKAMSKASARAWKTSILAASLVVVLSAVGSWMAVTRVRPHELSDALAAFEASWNAEDAAGVAASFPASVRQREAEWLSGVTAGLGWAKRWPRAAEPELRVEGNETWADYDLEGTTLTAGWSRDGRRWYLTDVELPVPPPDAAFEAFFEAWRRSDAGAIASLFPSGYREQMLEAIGRSTRRRQWSPYPGVLAVDKGPYEAGEVEMTFTVEDGEMETRWQFRSDGRWGLASLQFPKL